MSDLDMLIQMAKFYDVEIEELLNGEMKSENMDKQTEETLLKIADYNNKCVRRMNHGYINNNS